jgi:peptidoglycan/xylan/chitin deacetylase (PgdA/CDA1 family)
MQHRLRHSGGIGHRVGGGSSSSRSCYWTPLKSLLGDGHTLGFYNYPFGTTRTIWNKVSRFNDWLGSGNDFVENNFINQPIDDIGEITFDGVCNRLLMTKVVNQPVYIYMVVNPLTFSNFGRIFDSNDGAVNMRQIGVTPQATVYAGGSESAASTDFTLNNYHVVKIVFNGANGIFKIDDHVNITGNFGNTGLTNFNIGGSDGLTNWTSLKARAILIRDAALSVDDEVILYNYLNKIRDKVIGTRFFNNGKLIITFDDEWESQYTVVYPVLVAKGVKGTFYLSTNYLGGLLEGRQTFTWANAQTMYAAGMDLQSHTKNHNPLTTLTDAQIIAEMTGAKADFIANSLPEPQHLAYPGGLYDDRVKNIVRSYIHSSRTIEHAAIDKGTDKYILGSIWIDGIDDAGVVQLKLIMDAIQRQKGALTVYGHGASTLGSIPNYEIPTAHLEEIIDYAATIGMDVITHSELYALMT